MWVLTSAVHWWEESQLRVLVLTSLFIQFLLFIFSLLRRRALPGWVRFIMWLAYIGSDSVAIYALATLFNRHKQAAPGEFEDGGAGGSNAILQVVWAPVLLIHLGGDDGITAYNIEDNELWSRHLLTAVSQVTVAIYVFWKTWPPGSGDERLLQAAIVLFVSGIVKCFMKPLALKSASIYSLVSSPAAVKQEVYPLEEYVTRAKDFAVREETAAEARASASSITTMEDQGRRRPRRDNEEPAGTGTVVGRAKAVWRLVMLEWHITTDNIERVARAERIREMYEGHNESSTLIVDLSSSYSRRLSILEHFCGLTEKRAYGSVRQGLATTFLLLYTKLKTVNADHHQDNTGVEQLQSIFPLLIQGSRMVLPWAAIGLFHHSHREAYNDIDVKITYVLLCGTAVLEGYSISGFSTLQLTPTGKVGEQWPEMAAQYSFIGYFARNIKHSKKMWIARNLGCKDFLDQHWCMKPCFSSAGISELVLGYLKDGWKEKIHDATSYRSFNNHRSSEGLSLLSTNREKKPLLFNFDESVLLWHIATDFCFFSSSSSSDLAAEVPPNNDYGRNNKRKAVLCTQMSNYMVYLLFVNPEMLLPGSRRNLFTAAHQELEFIFKGEKPPSDMTELARKITSKLGSSSQEGSNPQETTIIDEAWMIAQKLQRLGHEKMWDVIQGVWVEMLCFSASRCRGYLHAKALGSGGEFLSYVWLMLFYMGMETFTDKLRREDLPSHEAAGTGNNATTAAALTSERVSNTTGGTTASASEAHADTAGASAPPSTSEISTAEDMV